MLYKNIVRPLLFRVPPETAHHLALRFLSHPAAAALLRPFCTPSGAGLERKLWGLTFPNPIGMGAGLDKDGVALEGWEALGFGFLELGGITPYPQPGNPAPRLFRIPSHQALINRFGFPNAGAEAVAARLRARREANRWPRVPVGIGIVKSKITSMEQAPADYLSCFRTLREWGDFFIVNVSSPNTPGLRRLQSAQELARIFGPLQEENHAGSATPKPILVKLAPDLQEEELGPIAEIIVAQGGAGVVATNTTLDKSSVPLKEEGGLSGKPLRQRSTEVIRFLSRQLHGRLPIIGVGGIFTAADAQEKLDAGATLLQAYTGLVYEGPRFVRNICEGLARSGKKG